MSGIGTNSIRSLIIILSHFIVPGFWLLFVDGVTLGSILRNYFDMWQSQVEFRYYTIFSGLRYSVFKVQKSTASIMLSLCKGFVAFWMAQVSSMVIDRVLIGLTLVPVSAFSH